MLKALVRTGRVGIAGARMAKVYMKVKSTYFEINNM